MNVEEYWAQTRRKWARRVVDPYGSVVEGCGFCVFDEEQCGPPCAACPVVRVYGDDCVAVRPVEIYRLQRLRCAGVKKLSALAQAVVQELDDKKAELIAAMREVQDGPI